MLSKEYVEYAGARIYFFNEARPGIILFSFTGTFTSAGGDRNLNLTLTFILCESKETLEF